MVVSSIGSGGRGLLPRGGIQLICYYLVLQSCDYMSEWNYGESSANYHGALTSWYGQGVSGPKITCGAVTPLSGVQGSKSSRKENCVQLLDETSPRFMCTVKACSFLMAPVSSEPERERLQSSLFSFLLFTDKYHFPSSFN